MTYRDREHHASVPIGVANADIDLVASIIAETKTYWIRGLFLFGGLALLMIVMGIVRWDEPNDAKTISFGGAAFFLALGGLITWAQKRNDPKRLVVLLRANPGCVKLVKRFVASDSRGMFRTTWLHVHVEGARPVGLKVGTDETAKRVADALKRLSPDAKIDLES